MTDLIEKTKGVLGVCEEIQKKYSCFTVITSDLALERAKFAQENPSLPLSGVFVTIKDCIVVKGVESTASSDILRGYVPVFDATVVEKLKSLGAIIIGKTIHDEFGFGSFSTNVGIGYEVPKNPNDPERSAGGSSGGAGVITKLFADLGINHIGIAESTGGSIECPASFCGVIGFCPTYGAVSRYGLISYANSLDKIGVMGKDVADVVKGLNAITGKDLRDSTSVETQKIDWSSIQSSTSTTTPLRIGLISDSVTDDLDPQVKSAFLHAVDTFKKKGAVVENVSLPLTFKYGISVYYILAVSEASTNLAALAGLRYGRQDVKANEKFTDYFTRIRSKHFGREAKRRIMLGTFMRMAGYRDAYYIRAAHIRSEIISEYKKLFEKFDVLISPTMPILAPKFSDISKLRPIDHYLADVMTVGPNLAGVPHASFPIHSSTSKTSSSVSDSSSSEQHANSQLPVGIMIMADHFKEELVLRAGAMLK